MLLWHKFPKRMRTCLYNRSTGMPLAEYTTKYYYTLYNNYICIFNSKKPHTALVFSTCSHRWQTCDPVADRANRLHRGHRWWSILSSRIDRSTVSSASRNVNEPTWRISHSSESTWGSFRFGWSCRNSWSSFRETVASTVRSHGLTSSWCCWNTCRLRSRACSMMGITLEAGGLVVFKRWQDLKKGSLAVK